MATVVPKLTIFTNQMIRAGETQKWEVHGMCEPAPFDSLAAAKLYCKRENKKLLGGVLRPFVPTHTILHPKRRIDVRMIEGACYTEREWAQCTQAEWEFRNGRVYFQGLVMGTRWSIVPYVLFKNTFLPPPFIGFAIAGQAHTLIHRINPWPVLLESGTQIRLTLFASPVSNALVDRIYVSQADPTPGARPWDSATDLTRIWNADNQGTLTVMANEAFEVPEVVYTVDRTKPLLIAMDFYPAAASGLRFTSNGAFPHSRGAVYWRAGAEAAIRKRSADYVDDASERFYFISKIEAGNVLAR